MDNPSATLCCSDTGNFEQPISKAISVLKIKLFWRPVVSEIWGHLGARLVMSGERSATNRPKGLRGVGVACLRFPPFW